MINDHSLGMTKLDVLGHRARELEHGAAAEDALDLADVAALVQPLGVFADAP